MTEQIKDLIFSNYKNQPPRPHLGCSVIGHQCDRHLWLKFRWFFIEKFTGQKLRLFKRGHDEEAKVISELRAAGLDIRNTGNNQLKIDFGCNVSGEIDGVIYENKKKTKIIEIKTHSYKSFNDLVNHGVKKSKPIHFAQIQAYMLGSNINECVYIAVNKNDDSIYQENIILDKNFAENIVLRAKKIAMAERMPEPFIGAKEDYFECKMCSFHKFCFGSKKTNSVHCRNCCFSTPMESGGFFCEKEKEKIPDKFQLKGCPEHVLHPDAVPWFLVGGDDKKAIFLIDGIRVENGEPCVNVFSSKELISNTEACINKDKFVSDLREQFDAQICG